jgi:DNA replication protein DnaC
MQAFNNDDKKRFKSVQDLFAMTQNVVGQEHCKEHNKTYNLMETPGGIVGDCPDCFKEKIDKENQEFVKKAMENREGWQEPFIKSNEHVSADLLEARVSNYIPTHESQEKAKKAVISYVKKFDGIKSLILSGKSGNGKSHLAYAITKGLRQQGYKTWLIKTRDILELVKSTYRHDAQLTEDKIMRVVESIDLLVLDDVGSEYVKPIDNGNESWASDVLYAIFEARLNKSIVCTTNYTDVELEKKYGYNGERITSRMLDKAKALRLQGDDHRRKNRF